MTTQTIAASVSVGIGRLVSAAVIAFAGIAIIGASALILANNISVGSFDPAMYLVPLSFIVFAASSLSVSARVARGEDDSYRLARLVTGVYVAIALLAIGTSLLSGDTFSAALATIPGFVAVLILAPLARNQATA